MMQFDFFTLRPEAFGLDLSDFSLKIAQLKKVGKSMKLVAFGEFPVSEGMIEEGEIKKEDEVASFIRSSFLRVQGSAMRTRNVIASLPEEKAFLQVIQLPKLKEEEISQAAMFEAEKYIPYSLETVYVDSQSVYPIKGYLDHSDVLLASLPRVVVDAYVSVLQKAGLKITALETESLALARALVQREISSMPLLLVDLGAARTSFMVFAGTSLRFTASIPISSNQLTEAVAKGFQVDFKTAEELKETHGVSHTMDGDGKKIFETLFPILKDLANKIQNYIDYYESHASHQHINSQETEIKKVILTGGGGNLKGLENFFSKELKKQTNIGNPWVNIMEFPMKTLPPFSLDESLRYSTVLGLALRGVRV